MKRSRGAPSRASVFVLTVALVCLAAGSPAIARSAKRDEAQRYFRLAQVQYEQGRTRESIDSLQKALKLDGDYAEAHYYLGFIHYQQSEYKPAEKEFRKAIHLNPYYTDAHNHLGLVYRETKEYDKALVEFQTALNDKSYASPEKIYLNIGHLYLARGMFPEAITSFQKSVSMKPDYLRGMLGLGTAYARAGQKDLADKELRKVVALGPDSPEAAEAQQLLDRKGKPAGT